MRMVSSTTSPSLHMQEWCQFRYLLYLESGAWATKYRHLLACGAVFLSPPIAHPDFFLRALTPGVDFVELAPKDSCLDMLGASRLHNSSLLRAGLPSGNGPLRDPVDSCEIAGRIHGAAMLTRYRTAHCRHRFLSRISHRPQHLPPQQLE